MVYVLPVPVWPGGRSQGGETGGSAGWGEGRGRRALHGRAGSRANAAGPSTETAFPLPRPATADAVAVPQELQKGPAPPQLATSPQPTVSKDGAVEALQHLHACGAFEKQSSRTWSRGGRHGRCPSGRAKSRAAPPRSAGRRQARQTNLCPSSPSHLLHDGHDSLVVDLFLVRVGPKHLVAATRRSTGVRHWFRPRTTTAGAALPWPRLCSAQLQAGRPAPFNCCRFAAPPHGRARRQPLATRLVITEGAAERLAADALVQSHLPQRLIALDDLRGALRRLLHVGGPAMGACGRRADVALSGAAPGGVNHGARAPRRARRCSLTAQQGCR